MPCGYALIQTAGENDKNLPPLSGYTAGLHAKLIIVMCDRAMFIFPKQTKNSTAAAKRQLVEQNNNRVFCIIRGIGTPELTALTAYKISVLFCSRAYQVWQNTTALVFNCHLTCYSTYQSITSVSFCQVTNTRSTLRAQYHQRQRESCLTAPPIPRDRKVCKLRLRRNSQSHSPPAPAPLPAPR